LFHNPNGEPRLTSTCLDSSILERLGQEPERQHELMEQARSALAESKADPALPANVETWLAEHR